MIFFIVGIICLILSIVPFWTYNMTESLPGLILGALAIIMFMFQEILYQIKGSNTEFNAPKKLSKKCKKSKK